jgi:hypothetical protein
VVTHNLLDGRAVAKFLVGTQPLPTRCRDAGRKDTLGLPCPRPGHRSSLATPFLLLPPIEVETASEEYDSLALARASRVRHRGKGRLGGTRLRPVERVHGRSVK